MRPASAVPLFLAAAYLIALALDVAALELVAPAASSPTGLAVWGIARMWSVALAVVIALWAEGRLRELKEIVGLSGRVLLPYFLAPLTVYGALGIYIALATPLGLFQFQAYIDAIANAIRQYPVQDAEALAKIAAYAQIAGAYIAAVTINAVAALGEEIGWRGYLFRRLGGEADLRNAVIIGAVWGLWHASAILLLGYNYYYNRWLGVPLFTAFTTALTYPLLLFAKASNSVLPAASLHGAVNALWPLTLAASYLSPEARELYLGIGALGIVTWALTSLTLYAVYVKLRSAKQNVPT